MIIHIYTYILECQGDADAGGGRLLRTRWARAAARQFLCHCLFAD